MKGDAKKDVVEVFDELFGKPGIWPVDPLMRFADALSRLDEGEAPRVLFMSDIIRDGIIIVPQGKRISADLDLESEKDRLREYTIFEKGGGHAFIGAYAAAVLRGSADARISIAAKIFDKDKLHLVDWYCKENPEKMGARPIDTRLVFLEKADGGSLNVIVEQDGKTQIIVGKQPLFRMRELDEKQRAEIENAIQKADVVAALSMRSPAFKEIIDAVIEGRMRINELFSDCTSGDDVQSNYSMLDLMRIKGDNGRSPITLLSINQHEARLYSAMLKAEEQGKKEELIDAFEAKKKIAGGSVPKKERARLEKSARRCEKLLGTGENGFQAAEFLNNRLGIPLLYHSEQGSCIIDARDEMATKFVPSIRLSKRPDNFVGAGDTLCGGMALAWAVKKKLEDPKVKADEEMRLSMEECLLIANAVTCYRLERVAELSEHGGERSWHEAVGSAERLIEWIEKRAFNQVTEVQSDKVVRINQIDLDAKVVRLSGTQTTAATLKHQRERMKSGIPVNEVIEDLGKALRFGTNSWYCVSYLNLLSRMRFSEEEVKQIAESVLSEGIARDWDSEMTSKRVGIILKKLGPIAVRELAREFKLAGGKAYGNAVNAAVKAGESFIRELETVLKECNLAILLYPWKHAEIDRLLDAALRFGDWQTARTLSKLIPTVRLAVPPHQESPAVKAAKTIRGIALKTRGGDEEVAQALYDATTAHSNAEGFRLMMGVYQIFGDRYDIGAYAEATHSALQAVEENLALSGVKFKPKERLFSIRNKVVIDADPREEWMMADEARVKMLVEQVVDERSLEPLHERDFRDLKEKMAVLQRIQLQLIVEHPKVKRYAKETPQPAKAGRHKQKIEK